MIKKTKQKFGAYYAIGLESDSKLEIEQNHWSYYNKGLTNGELHYLNDYSAYFVISEKNLIKYYQEVWFHARFDCERIRGKTLDNLSEKFALEQIDGLEYRKVLKYTSNAHNEYAIHANIDNIEFYSPPSEE